MKLYQVIKVFNSYRVGSVIQLSDEQAKELLKGKFVKELVANKKIENKDKK